MRRPAAALLLFAGIGLAGCGALAPFATVPRPPQPGQPPGPRVAVCYNTLTAGLAELRQRAQRECGEGMLAEPVDTDWQLDTCPLLLPTRASFVCLPGPRS